MPDFQSFAQSLGGRTGRSELTAGSRNPVSSREGIATLLPNQLKKRGTGKPGPPGRCRERTEDVRLSPPPTLEAIRPDPGPGFGAKAFHLVRGDVIRTGLCRRFVNQ